MDKWLVVIIQHCTDVIVLSFEDAEDAYQCFLYASRTESDVSVSLRKGEVHGKNNNSTSANNQKE